MDDASAPEPSLPTAEQIAQSAVIDQAALEHWFSLPVEAEIVLSASRADLDRLFLGLRFLAFAQGDTLAALQQYVAGEKDAAERSFATAANRHTEALTNISAFTAGMMKKATVDG